MFRARAISTRYANGVVRCRATSVPCGATTSISKSYTHCQSSTISLWQEPVDLAPRTRQQSTDVMSILRMNPRCLHSETVVEGNRAQAGHEVDIGGVAPQVKLYLEGASNVDWSVFCARYVLWSINKHLYEGGLV